VAGGDRHDMQVWPLFEEFPPNFTEIARKFGQFSI
jgi:hypothetical protein